MTTATELSTQGTVSIVDFWFEYICDLDRQNRFFFFLKGGEAPVPTFQNSMATQSSYAAMYSRAQKAVSRRSTPKAGSASRNASGANPKVQSSRPRRASSSGDRVKILKARDVSDEQNRFSHINVSLRIRPKQGRRQTSYQHQDGSKFIEFRVQQKNTKSKFVGLDNDRAAARKKFVFSCPKIFPENSTQEAVFEETSSPVVSKALDGINGTIFTYGQTGSGKTYTLTGGSSYDERGIIPRTIESYFRTIRARQKANHQIQCTVSYVEVYNEHIFDLLNPENKGKKLEDWTELKLRENSGDNSVGAAGSSSRPQTPSSHGTSDTSGAKDQANNRMSFEVVGLQEVIVQSEEEAINLLFMGNVNRVTSETPMNNASSRSHCIFTLKVCCSVFDKAIFTICCHAVVILIAVLLKACPVFFISTFHFSVLPASRLCRI